ncbi:MAG: hypothetical protein JWP57_723 [Spirosoma sp.]|nr:hypothetical protein [Spirosoma sp.]
MKTAGIVCDNSKVDMFKKELTAAGFTDFDVKPFTKDTSNIRVKFEPARLKELSLLCKKVELNAKHSN